MDHHDTLCISFAIIVSNIGKQDLGVTRKSALFPQVRFLRIFFCTVSVNIQLRGTKCILIELNSFGASRGAGTYYDLLAMRILIFSLGSGLFHWIREQKLLYNESDDQWEFRLCKKRI